MATKERAETSEEGVSTIVAATEGMVGVSKGYKSVRWGYKVIYNLCGSSSTEAVREGREKGGERGKARP